MRMGLNSDHRARAILQVAKLPEAGVWVVNGFYGSMRAKFTSPDLNPNGILWMKLSWKESDLTWEAFRNDVVGATDCAKAVTSDHSDKWQLHRLFSELWRVC